jgi:putative PIN family toxin of toxin-antitoxin system
MKVFVDSNVWASALGTKGLCRDLVLLLLQKQGAGQLVICISDTVIEETQRVLRDKFRVSEEAQAAANDVLLLCTVAAPGGWQPPSDFPDPDDAPLVAAAIAVGADWFVTGDQALLDLGKVEALPMLSPRLAYAHLRGLS